MKFNHKSILEEKIIREDMEDIYHRNIDWNQLNGKKIFISGAYGMIASYIVLFLCYISEYKEIKVDIIAQGRNLEKAKNKFGNLLQKEYLHFTSENICEKINLDGCIDYIIHAASPANPRLYTTNPVEVMKPNILGTYYLLKLAKEKNVRGFLLFSSGDVYGKVDHPENITEETVGKVNQLDNHSCYSESKRMAETMGYCYFKEYHLPVKIVRIGHTYGPTVDIKNDPRVFAAFLNNLINEKNIEILSDGLSKRPFCYLADAVAAYFKVLLNGENGEAYNICNSKELISIGDFARLIAEIDKDKHIDVVYKLRNQDDLYVENISNRSNNPNDDKLRKLGFEYHFSTKMGLKRTYEFLKEKK